jgi:hypothetical protein
MPVYKNETVNKISERIEISFGQTLTLTFEPGETKQTQYVLTNGNLTLISETPYYNPVVTAEAVTSTGAVDDKTVSLNFDAHVLSIYNPSAILVTCFLQSKSNTPGLPIYPGAERLIDLNHNCGQIILEFAAAATVYVEQRRN